MQLLYHYPCRGKLVWTEVFLRAELEEDVDRFPEFLHVKAFCCCTLAHFAVIHDETDAFATNTVFSFYQ